MADFLLPDLGEGLTDAEVVHWLVAVGDTVTVDQPVVEVETAKAAVEVPIPFAGKVTAVFGAPGERVAVGTPLISVATGNGSTAGVAGVDGPSVAPAAEPVSSEYSGNVLVGYGTSASTRRRRRKASSPASADLAVEAGLSPAPAADPLPAISPLSAASDANVRPNDTNTPLASESAGSAVAVISPVVRRLARDRGIDLRTVTASDPSGVIRRCDVEAFSNETAATATPETATEPVRPAATSSTPGVERVPLTGLRGVAAQRLARSRREIPEATVWVDVDATALVEARRALNAAAPDRPVSLLALVARFCVLGLRRYRELNSRVTTDAVELLPEVNVGFAAQTDRGLLVPVVHGAQAMTTRQLSEAIQQRTEQARAGRLTPAELSGGTFTVNNYGVFGVDGSAAIINHPEVAMLGVGRIMQRPWVDDGALAIRQVTELTLAFDHRACDGGVAGGFLRFVADCVENPVTALGEL